MMRVALLLCLLPSIAYSAVYKCIGPNGSIAYQNTQCENSQSSERIQTEEDRRRDLEQKVRREAEEAEQKANAEYDSKRQSTIEAAQAAGRYVIEYVVSGSALVASLTYSNLSGGTEQHQVAVPWRMYFTASKGHLAYISAQNKAAYGRVRVEILVNGVSVKTSESSAEYGIATASGRL